MSNGKNPASLTITSDKVESQDRMNTEKLRTAEIQETVPRNDVQKDPSTRNLGGNYDNRSFPVLRSIIQQRKQEMQTHVLTERAIALRQRMERQRRREERGRQ
jgi:hypothetical protein